MPGTARPATVAAIACASLPLSLHIAHEPAPTRFPEFGQSIWLDFISREVLESGELATLVESGEVRGVTSNPAIFEKAIGEGTRVRADARRSCAGASRRRSAFELYEALAVARHPGRVRRAAARLRPSKARDGYVSLEVTLHDGRARDRHPRRGAPPVGDGRPAERDDQGARAREDGVAAFEELIADGINVNVTLLFARRRPTSRSPKAYIARSRDARQERRRSVRASRASRASS